MFIYPCLSNLCHQLQNETSTIFQLVIYRFDSSVIEKEKKTQTIIPADDEQKVSFLFLRNEGNLLGTGPGGTAEKSHPQSFLGTR